MDGDHGGGGSLAFVLGGRLKCSFGFLPRPIRRSPPFGSRCDDLKSLDAKTPASPSHSPQGKVEGKAGASP
ncbi:hypothetical protein [Azospirillum doebereinerae]